MIIDNQTIGVLGFSIGSFLIGLMVGSNLKSSENIDNRSGGYTPKEIHRMKHGHPIRTHRTQPINKPDSPKKKLRDKNNEYKYCRNCINFMNIKICKECPIIERSGAPQIKPGTKI